MAVNIMNLFSDLYLSNTSILAKKTIKCSD
jgi:hypothetical protein